LKMKSFSSAQKWSTGDHFTFIERMLEVRFIARLENKENFEFLACSQVQVNYF
jgi:hypothetical protein